MILLRAKNGTLFGNKDHEDTISNFQASRICRQNFAKNISRKNDNPIWHMFSTLSMDLNACDLNAKGYSIRVRTFVNFYIEYTVAFIHLSAD